MILGEPLRIRNAGTASPMTRPAVGDAVDASPSGLGEAGDVVVACRGVGYVYPDGKVANRDVDLSVHSGEIVSVVGPNGAGKTTLLRQICGDLRPTFGEIRVKDISVLADPWGAKQYLGIAPQSAGVFSALTVADHLLYFGRLKNLGRRKLALEAERVLRECHLTEQKDLRTDRLSGGQKRKLILALALLGDSEILILDEPTVGLDPVSRRAIWNAIRRQKDEGKAILLTTHYMEEAEALSDRIAFVKSGTTVLTGTLREMFALMGKSVRLASLNPARGNVVRQWYFDSVDEAQAAAKSLDLSDYSVGHISLEDVFFHFFAAASPKDEELE